jgi:hypothetical protein
MQLDALAARLRGIPNARLPVDDNADVGAVVGEYLLLIGIHMAAGWTIGVSYYRLGGWIGTALLPVTLLPLFAVEWLLAVSWFGQMMGDRWNWSIERVELSVAVPLSTAIIIAVLVMNYLIIRRMPLKP